MKRFSNEQELLEVFRPLDREQVQVPSDWAFPLLVRDYVSWVEPSGHRTYLVFEDPARQNALGIVFKRVPAPADAPSQMCDWCHSVRRADTVGLMTVSAGKGRSVGLTLCRDLSCREKVIRAPGINDVRESLSVQSKIMRIVSRMSEFANRNLF